MAISWRRDKRRCSECVAKTQAQVAVTAAAKAASQVRSEFHRPYTTHAAHYTPVGCRTLARDHPEAGHLLTSTLCYCIKAALAHGTTRMHTLSTRMACPVQEAGAPKAASAKGAAFLSGEWASPIVYPFPSLQRTSVGI